jgi:glutamate-1-semialdehyde 2,1-aminomutase
MGEIYTPRRAQEFLEYSEAFRLSLNRMFAAEDVPMHANGMGSIIAIHFSRKPTLRTADISPGCLALRPLLHLEMLLEGVLICSRGDMFLSLPMTEDHLAQARAGLDEFIGRHRSLIEETLQAYS